MRFLTLELDGRNRVDEARQRLSGVMIGQQMVVAHAGAGAARGTQTLQPTRSPFLRRWLQSRIEGLQRAGRLG